MNLGKEQLERSLTRLKLYWKKSQKGYKSITFYSLDKRRDIERNDPGPGIAGLEERIIRNPRYRGKYKVAIIYNNHGAEEKLLEYNELGQRI